ncbi:MAG: metallophosphoesterase, partial [Pseudomonadota bacterium]
MKIIYASDIHEAYKTLQKLFQMTDADLYIISGDLLYSAFSSWDLASRFTDLQQFILSWGLSRG